MAFVSRKRMAEIAEEIKTELKEKSVDEILEDINSKKVIDAKKEKHRIYKKRWMEGKQYVGD